MFKVLLGLVLALAVAYIFRLVYQAGKKDALRESEEQDKLPEESSNNNQ